MKDIHTPLSDTGAHTGAARMQRAARRVFSRRSDDDLRPVSYAAQRGSAPLIMGPLEREGAGEECGRPRRTSARFSSGFDCVVESIKNRAHKL